MIRVGKAVTDYRAQHGLSAEIVEIDWTAVLWRKE
jgi:O-methyltransferase